MNPIKEYQRKRALVSHLISIDPDFKGRPIERYSFDDRRFFGIGRQNFAVLTDAEVDEWQRFYDGMTVYEIFGNVGVKHRDFNIFKLAPFARNIFVPIRTAGEKPRRVRDPRAREIYR